ncbi:MAG TPA: PKD domain-containing protein, partial [Thermoanaerobaculia bacterium]|nr:PKD domain-containing protein [Thermoanaerobaculia bacterium]
HRLQIRDFGSHRTMMATHAVDVGGGRAGVRWYELRESGGNWSLHQEGTYGPNDGENRWMPSIAMNANGDIGIGYMISSTNTYVSMGAVGQTAANSGTGVLDSAEVVCAAGTGVQEGVARAGDYSSTNVDEATGNFWHTNEVFTQTGQFQWNTYVCEFSVGGGGGNIPPTASFTFNCNQNTRQCDFDASGSSDPDGTITDYDWDFGDNNSASGVMVSHTYANYGDFDVTLTVTDDMNAMDSDQQTVMLVDPNVITITLSANGFKVQGKHNIDLTWTTNSTATDFDVYRNGGLLTTTPNDGAFTDATQNKGKATYTHQVCEAGSQANCSNVTVTEF